MTLDKYERDGKQLYEEFSKLVATLLSEEIAKRGEIKLQHVQHRPKRLNAAVSVSDRHARVTRIAERQLVSG